MRPWRPADRVRMAQWYRGLEEHIARRAPRELNTRLPRDYGARYEAAMLPFIRKRGGFILVVELRGRPVGFLTAIVQPSPPSVARTELRPNVQGFVLDVFVEDRARGRGAGRELFREAERKLAEAGCDNLQLSVVAGNREAREFYRAGGFSEWDLRLRKPLARAPPRDWGEAQKRRRKAARSLRPGR